MPVITTVAPRSSQDFPRQFRLTRTDEYSSVFDFRRALRGQWFMLHYLPRPQAQENARLGLVVGKKLLKKAVHRNLVKRLAREAFRRRRAQLMGYDLIFRLAVRPQKLDRRLMADDLVALMEKLWPRAERSRRKEAQR